jgi:hypothetical protein
MNKHAQTLHAALTAKRRAARISAEQVVWFDDRYAHTVTVDEDGTPNLLRLTWNVIDTRMAIWWEYRLYCLRTELPAVVKWMAEGYNDLDWSTNRFPFGITRWPQRECGPKTVFQLRTAKYQDALERGKLASRNRDFAAMDKWLAQFGEPAIPAA